MDNLYRAWLNALLLGQSFKCPSEPKKSTNSISRLRRKALTMSKATYSIVNELLRVKSWGRCLYRKSPADCVKNDRNDSIMVIFTFMSWHREDWFIAIPNLLWPTLFASKSLNLTPLDFNRGKGDKTRDTKPF